MKMELRMNATEIQANEDGSMTVSGYVNKTGQESEMLGNRRKFKEIIKRGAWTKALNKAKEIHFLAEHDNRKILASTRNGSLQLREDDNGLYMTATISPTSWGKDYYQLIKDGILQNMSFGFRAVKDSWRNLGTHFERVVDELELFEVSVVRDPAYSSSTISARGIDLVDEEVPESEVNLRTIEIRSDEDIEKIAKKLFEYIQENAKVAEGHEDETDEEDKEKDKENDKEPEEETPNDKKQKEEEIEQEKDTEEKSDEESDEDKDNEETDKDNEEITDKEPYEDDPKDKETDAETPDEASKIRDFIKKIKEEE